MKREDWRRPFLGFDHTEKKLKSKYDIINYERGILSHPDSVKHMLLELMS